MRRSFELFHHLVMYIQIASLKLCSLPTSTWNISLISTCPHTNRHHLLLHPLDTMRHRTWGGYVTLALVHDFISTSETLVQIGMWAIWKLYFLAMYNIVAMDHPNFKPNNSVLFKSSFFWTVKYNNFVPYDLSLYNCGHEIASVTLKKKRFALKRACCAEE